MKHHVVWTNAADLIDREMKLVKLSNVTESHVITLTIMMRAIAEAYKEQEEENTDDYSI